MGLRSHLTLTAVGGGGQGYISHLYVCIFSPPIPLSHLYVITDPQFLSLALFCMSPQSQGSYLSHLYVTTDPQFLSLSL